MAHAGRPHTQDEENSNSKNSSNSRTPIMSHKNGKTKAQNHAAPAAHCTNHYTRSVMQLEGVLEERLAQVWSAVTSSSDISIRVCTGTARRLVVAFEAWSITSSNCMRLLPAHIQQPMLTADSYTKNLR